MPARAQISETNTPGSKLPLFKPVIPAEAQAVRDMAQADPTKLQGGTVETSKTSMLNAPADQPMYGPIGTRPEERVLPHRAYGEDISYRSYRDVANKLGKEIGSPDQEQAMAVMARRIAARLGRA